jgi:aspartyl-tRNA(Asn)/glutamyl-tRNA(Gln) amidotransferase subunit A
MRLCAEGMGSPMTATSLAAKPATELAHLIRSKAVSPVEVMRATIAHAEALNPSLNAICTPTYEAAMDAGTRGRAGGHARATTRPSARGADHAQGSRVH